MPAAWPCPQLGGSIAACRQVTASRLRFAARYLTPPLVPVALWIALWPTGFLCIPVHLHCPPADYDCSYVRISGGSPLEATAPRPFNTGIGTRFADRCVSSVNSLGKCVVEPCTKDGTASGESRFTGGEMVPKEFTNGMTPPPLTSSMYLDLPQRLPQSPPTVSPTPEPTPSPTLSPSPAKRRLWVGIKGFYVVDTRGVRADTLSMSAVNTVSRSHYPMGFTIEASTKGNVKVQAVAFLVNKAHVRTEWFPRWSLTGDRQNYWAPWRGYKKGHLMLVRAKPWAKRATKNYARTVRIRVVD